MCRLAFDAARCRVLLSCLPPLPSLALRQRRPGGMAARAASAPATAIGRARSRQDACTLTAAPKAARSAVRMHPHCTRDDTATASSDTPDGTTRCTATCSESAAIMGGFQPDWMRDPDHGGCADRPEIPAVERRRVGHTQEEQFAGFEAAALLPGWQRPAPAVGRQHGGRRHAVDADDAASAAQLLRRDGAHALEQRHARRQVAEAARPARRRLAAAWSGRCCPRTRDVAASRCRGLADRRDTADRHAVGRVVDRRGSGCTKDAQASAARPQADRPANTRRARRRERGCGGMPVALATADGSVMAASSRLARAACRSAVYSGSGRRAASRLASVRQYAGETAAGAMPSASMASMHSSTARTWFSPSAWSSKRAPAARRGCAALHPAACKPASP